MPKSDPAFSARPPFAVQILTIVGYTAFAIPVAVVAMDEFGVLGLALTAFLAWQWTNVARFGATPSVGEIVEKVRPHVTGAPEETTPNASFDRYKAEMMARLEKEQTNFEGFLTRLRETKDKSEFETFMTDRERSLGAARASPSSA